MVIVEGEVASEGKKEGDWEVIFADQVVVKRESNTANFILEVIGC